MAIADQVAGHPHGFANPAFYALSRTGAFHDIAGTPPAHAVVRVDYANGVDTNTVNANDVDANALGP